MGIKPDHPPCNGGPTTLREKPRERGCKEETRATRWPIAKEFSKNPDKPPRGRTLYRVNHFRGGSEPMVTRQLDLAVQGIKRLVIAQATRRWTDTEFLDRYATRREE